MKARAIGLSAEDYTTDRVRDLTALYKGHRVMENVPRSSSAACTRRRTRPRCAA